jgi:hypothetical protein
VKSHTPRYKTPIYAVSFGPLALHQYTCTCNTLTPGSIRYAKSWGTRLQYTCPTSQLFFYFGGLWVKVLNTTSQPVCGPTVTVYNAKPCSKTQGRLIKLGNTQRSWSDEWFRRKEDKCNVHFAKEPGCCSRYSDTLRAGRSGVRCPVVARDSCTRPGRPCSSTSLLYNVYRGPSTGGSGLKRPGRDDHPPLTSAEVKERVQLYFLVPSVPLPAC